MTKFLILITVSLLPLLGFSQDGIGKTQKQVMAMYPPSATLQQDSINTTKLVIKNTAENWKREFLFENGKCLVEKLYFPRAQKQQWMEKLKAMGWKYNKLWHWYFLKKGSNKYYAEYLLNDWDLNYLLFEIKSASWMEEEK